MTCPYCGKEIEDNSRICIFCERFIAPPVKEEPMQAPERIPEPELPATVEIARPDEFSITKDNIQKTKRKTYAQSTQPLSSNAYLGTLLMAIIPVAGLIVLIVWCCCSNVNINRRRLSFALIIVKLIFLFFFIGAAFALYFMNYYSFYFFW